MTAVEVVSSFLNEMLTSLVNGDSAAVEASFAYGDNFQINYTEGPVTSHDVTATLTKLLAGCRGATITVELINAQQISFGCLGVAKVTANGNRDGEKHTSAYQMLLFLEQYDDSSFFVRHFTVICLLNSDEVKPVAAISAPVLGVLPTAGLPTTGFTAPPEAEVPLPHPKKVTTNHAAKEKSTKHEKPRRQEPKEEPKEEKAPEAPVVSAHKNEKPPTPPPAAVDVRPVEEPKAKEEPKCASSWASRARDAKDNPQATAPRRVVTPPPQPEEAKAKAVVDKVFCRWPSLELTEAQVRAALQPWSGDLHQLSLRTMKEKKCTLIFAEFTARVLEALQNHPPQIRNERMKFDAVR